MAARFYDPNEDARLTRLERNAERYDRYRLSTTPEQARNIAQMASVWGRTLQPGAIYSLGAAGLTYDGHEVQAAVDASVRKQNKSLFNKIGDTVSGAFAAATDPIGDVLGGAYDVAKGFSRGAFAGLQFIPEAAQANWRLAMSGEKPGLGHGNLGKVFGQTTIGAGHNEIMAKGGYAGLLTGSTKVDYGSGLFIQTGSHANSAVGRRQRDAALAAGRRPDGRAIDIGRSFADLFVEDSGSKRHSILSGLADGLVTLVDPSVLFGGTAAKSIRASKELTGGKWVNVAGSVIEDTPAKAKARAFGAGQATPLEFTEDVIRHGSDNPRLNELRDLHRAGLATKGELAQEIARLRKQIEVDQGLVAGATRHTAVPEQAAKWLESDHFHALAERLAETDAHDFNRVRKATKGKLPVELVDELTSRANTPDQVRDAVARALNAGTLTEKFRLPDMGRIRRMTPPRLLPLLDHHSRMAARLPGKHLILDDQDEMVEFADRYMRSAHLDEATINRHALEFTRATGRQGIYQAFDNMMKSVETKLVKQGTDPAIARALTRAWERYRDDVAYNLDATGNEVWVTRSLVGGKVKESPHPHLYREYVNRAIPLPNLREIRTLSSQPIVRAMLDEYSGSRGAKAGSAINEIADFITNEVWVPLRLIRLGFLQRNIAEAQLRMATSGYDNAFTDLGSFLAWAVAEDGTSKVAKLLRKAGVKTGRGAIDPTGASYKRKSELANGFDEFGRALSHNGSLWRTPASGGRRRVVGGGVVRVTKDQGDEFLEGWAGELSDLATDDIGHAVLRASNLDEVKDWFWRGEGRKLYDNFAQDEDFIKEFGGRAGADRFIDSVWERIQTKTGGSVDLLDLMRTGRINGTPLWRNDGINSRVLPELKKLVDYAPEVVKGGRMTYAKAEQSGHWRRFVNASFDLLASRPENFMNNSPVFRQEHWRQVIRSAGHLRKDDQARLLENAHKAKMPKDMIRQLQRNIAERNGQLSLDELNKLAAQRSVRAMRRLLYNAYDKQQFFDVARTAFVFGDALRNTAEVWPRLLAENPGALGRTGLGFQAMRDADIDEDGKGLFYKDPKSGKEVFAYPFSSKLVEMGTGLKDTPLTAPVEGLNLLTQSVIPSLGPVTAFAASVVVPDRPEFEAIRKVLLPYGEPGFVDQAVPPWASKILTGLSGDWSPKQNRQYASTVAEIVRYLETTGEYDIGDPQEYQDLLKDAKKKASRLYVIRGLAQFGTPSAPSPKHIAYDKNGKVWETVELSKIYSDYQKKYGIEALPHFLEDFGQLALAATVHKTDNLGTSSANKEALDFVRKHPDTARRYKQTYGLFLSDEGPFNFAAYQRQVDSGEREVKSPEQFVAEVRQRLARSLYNAAKEAYNGDPQMLRKVREQLEARFEFNNLDFNPGGSKALILELQQAVRDPVLADTEAGKALKLYLTARDRALAVARERDIGDLRTNQRAEDLRQWLAQIGNTAVREFPAFSTMWERVFAREIGE